MRNFAGDRDYPREVGHHHEEGRGPDVHAARTPRHHRRDPPAARQPRARLGEPRRPNHPPDRGNPG